MTTDCPHVESEFTPPPHRNHLKWPVKEGGPRHLAVRSINLWKETVRSSPRREASEGDQRHLSGREPLGKKSSALRLEEKKLKRKDQTPRRKCQNYRTWDMKSVSLTHLNKIEIF